MVPLSALPATFFRSLPVQMVSLVLFLAFPLGERTNFSLHLSQADSQA